MFAPSWRTLEEHIPGDRDGARCVRGSRDICRCSRCFVPIALVVLALGALRRVVAHVADGVREQACSCQDAAASFGRECMGIVRRRRLSLSRRGDAQPLHFTAPDRGRAWNGERVVVHVPPLALGASRYSFEGLQHFFHGSEGRWIQTDGRADKALVTIAAGDGRELVGLEIERLTGKAKIDARDFNLIVEAADGGVHHRATASAGELAARRRVGAA